VLQQSALSGSSGSGRVQDVFHQDYVAPSIGLSMSLISFTAPEKPARAITGHRDEIERVVDRNRTGQVREKNRRPSARRSAPAGNPCSDPRSRRDLAANFPRALGNLLLGDQNLHLGGGRKLERREGERRTGRHGL